MQHVINTINEEINGQARRLGGLAIGISEAL